MSATDERLYKLLPAIYRLRDAANGEPLRALLAAMQQELGLLESDITDLYESWFIETCPEWVVPYIGDLLGVRGLFPVDNKQLSLRPYVGNTIRYRRRKGTASMLEGLARDATGGWPAAAVEYFQLLATNQNLNHVRWRDLRTPDLRDTNALELLGGPFERAARFAEVRRISVERGRYNIPNVGVFLWRLLGMSIHAAPAVADGGSTTRFRFDQLGLDAPLFGLQRSAGGTTRRVTESDVPGPLRPRALYEELNAVRAAETSGDPPVYAFFDPDQPVLEIAVFDPSQTDPLLQWPAIPSDRIQICDLGSGATWTAPTPLEFTPAGGSLTRCAVAVDPKSGRMVFFQPPLQPVRVSYQRGFAAELGGGDYERADTIDPVVPGGPTLITVKTANPAAPADAALATAIAAWAGGGDVIFEIADSGSYSLGDLVVPAATRVEIRAQDQQRPTVHLPATLHVTLGGASALTLSGLWLTDGGIEVLPIQPSADPTDHTLRLVHSTLVPGVSLAADGTPSSPAGLEAVSLALSADPTAAGRLLVELDHCVTGRLAFGDAAMVELTVSDSIIDGLGGKAPALAGVDETHLERVTVLGAIATRALWASDSILDGLVTCERTQVGCLRFSYVGRDDDALPPVDSIVPRRYRCQPDLAIAAADASRELDVRERLRPQLVARHFGRPPYAQLAAGCAVEIRTGAEDGSEMGAFASLHQPQRLTNLATALDEYLRFGLEAGVFFVT